MIPSRFSAALAIVAAGCGLASAAAPQAASVAYVVLGEDGAASARVITDALACPTIVIDGHGRPMTVRAAAATLPMRPTASKPELSKASAFPVIVCEAKIPVGARTARVEGRSLPLPRRRFDRIVVIGDTGCRLKASDRAYQACNRPDAYPFSQVAALAAAWKPDLVVHVGDYHYRETACPEGDQDCAGSPWGYGWDAWNADFFTPGAKLLAAAPWVLARGNHENCNRAGQGWFRLLDARPLTAGHDCLDPANDFAGDDSAPYAVPLGGGVQIVVMDLSIAPNHPLAPDDPRAAQFGADYDALRTLSDRADSTIMVTHKPVLAFGAQSAGGKVTLFDGNAAIQSAFLQRDPAMFPPKVDILLAGHVHLWEQLSFSTPFPTQFVAGFSGTQEETVPLPQTLPPGSEPAPGAAVEHFSSWVQGFGYMTLERAGPRRWDVKVWNLAGQVVNRCRIEGRHSSCERGRVG